MRRCVWWIAVCLCWGCEKEAPSVDFAPKSDAEPGVLVEDGPSNAPSRRKTPKGPPVFGVVTAKMAVAPKDASVKLPTEDVVRGWFVEALRADAGVVWDPEAKGARELRVAYTADTAIVRNAKYEAVQLQVVIAHQGQQVGGYEKQLARALEEGAKPEAALEETARALATDIALDVSLKNKTLEELKARAAAPALLPAYTAESVLGRFKAERAFEDEALVTRYLTHPSERVVLLAAGWLVQRKAKVGPQLIVAAERLSRESRLVESKLVGLQALIFLMGSVSDETVRVYLSAAASGHEVPAIRQAASQALGR